MQHKFGKEWKNDMTGYIYKVTNNFDDMVYIGQTKAKYLCKRKAQHKYDAINFRKGAGCAFHEAIRQHGIEAFTFEVYEVVEVQELDAHEAMAIELHKEHAYNVKEVAVH